MLDSATQLDGLGARVGGGVRFPRRALHGVARGPGRRARGRCSTTRASACTVPAWPALHGSTASASRRAPSTIAAHASATAPTMLDDGVVSTVNDAAARLGCLPGHTCREAAQLPARRRPGAGATEVPEIGETRLRITNTGHRAVWAHRLGLARPRPRTGAPSWSPAPTADCSAATRTTASSTWTCSRRSSTTRAAARTMRATRACRCSTRAASPRPPCRATRRASATADRPTTPACISRVNAVAARLDVKEGMSARDAVARLVGLG